MEETVQEETVQEETVQEETMRSWRSVPDGPRHVTSCLKAFVTLPISSSGYAYDGRGDEAGPTH